MEITRQPDGSLLHLTLQGRLDGAWSEHVSAALTRAVEEGWHQLRLDLCGVTFVSSAGIRVLVIHYKQLLRIKGGLAVVNPSPEARSVLEMAGLGSMIAVVETKPPASPPMAPPEPCLIERGRLRAEVHPLDPDGRFVARLLENGACARFPKKTLGLGLGAVGNDPNDCKGRFGEFLALGGAAITQPADGKQSTDFVIEQGALVPEITAISGIAAEGDFASMIRFDGTGSLGGGIPLSALADLAVELCGNRSVGFALVAETEALVGAALCAQPDANGAVSFDFPEVRDRLLFTAEPAWPRSFSLAVGFAAPSRAGTIASLLRPSCPSGDGVQLHVHAAAFSYRPLTKGLLCLDATVQQLLDEERTLGLLHLLNDWRPGGLGESRFFRGALWMAPLEL